MFETNEGALPLDDTFYDGPVIHKVKPLCQAQRSWALKAPSLLSQIPAAQDLQVEATLSSHVFSQRSKQRAQPAQNLHHHPIDNAYDQGHTECHRNSQEMENSVLWTREASGKRVQAVVNTDPEQERNYLLETRPLLSASATPLKTRLFRDSTRKIWGIGGAGTSKQMRPITDAAGCFGEMSGTMRASHSVATCRPFTGLEQGSGGKGSLRSVSEIPVKFRNVFKEFPYFNYVQSQALDDVLYSTKNFVACAPTGSGKTVLLELAIIRLLIETPEPWHNVRAVYMAPIKALCSQQYENWKQKFGPLGLICKELTGDTEIDDIFEIQDAHLILTTPEKWDSLTRKWKDNCLLPSVCLFLIDEVHVVKDKTRGATLEVVVSRMKTMHSYRLAVRPELNANLRFIAVSATIPNIRDLSEWLSDQSGPAAFLEMDESHRPVKLRKVVLGFPCGQNKNEFKFDLSLSYKMANIIQTYSNQKPTLVFCSTRKGVQQSAAVLSKDARFILSHDNKQRLMRYSNSLLDIRLRDLLACGIGYHHAGMDVSDRKLIEEAFTTGDLPVLFTTSTLAMGVNLPAHLVVIKSTLHYVGGACEEYSEADVLQMVGRAGRPQFDTTATAVIMTRSQTKDKYTNFLSGVDSIESSLHTHLVEHLNAEIVLHTISDVNMALDWIRSTFLYIRALKNPTHYGFQSQLDKCGIETKLQELCLKNLNSLASLNLITMDEDINIKPTETGKIMARCCVAFDTVKQFHKVTGTETLPELIDMISMGKEFSDVQLRVNEKKTLNMLNRDKNRTTIRFPMEGKIKNREMKVSCLIQAQLGCIPVQEFGLIQDTGKIFRNGIRVSKYLSEFLSHHSRENFSAQLNSLILAKCFRAKLWENSPYVSRQLDKIGLSLATAMVNVGLTTFSKIEQTSPRELELIVNRNPPFGNQIKEGISRLPKYEVSLEQIPRYSLSTAEVIVSVHLKNYIDLATKRTAPDHHFVTLIIGDCDNNVVFQQKITDSLLVKSGSWTKKVELIKSPKGEELNINLISSEYVGLDIQQKYSAFYSGSKRFGAESFTDTWRDGESRQSSHPSSSSEKVQPPRQQHLSNHVSDKDSIAQETFKRECNHLCKNKALCGHECCKVGVEMVMKKSGSDSTFSSYYTELKMKNATLAEAPAKRLRRMMNSDNAAVDLQRFSYKPTYILSSTKKIEGSRYYPQDSTSFVSFPEAVYGDCPEDFYSENAHSKSNHLLENFAPNLTSSTDMDHLQSDSLNVTFDLGVNDWDDFDDENLIDASDFCPESITCNLTGPDQLNNSGSLALQTLGSYKQGPRTLAFQQSSSEHKTTLFGNQPHAVTPQTRVFREKHVHAPNQRHEKNTLFQRSFDFFSKTDTTQKENAYVSRKLPTNQSSEDNIFLTMFDGVF